MYNELEYKPSEGKKESIDFIKIANESYVDPREDIKPPETVLIQTSETGESRIIATLGNFSLIIGKAKSRKSFLMAIIAAALASTLSPFNLSGTLPPTKRNVLFFDTEQSRYHVQLLLNRICRLINVKIPENVKVHALRKYNAFERVEIIEHILYSTSNLGVVIIDGLRDLVTSINDEEQATIITGKLMKWSEELDIHIFTVLHQNKSDENARGHLGTEGLNKAETTLSATKSEGDKNITIVEPLSCRNQDPYAFAFEVIDDLPVFTENYEIRTQTKPSKIDLNDIENFKLFEMLNSIYSRQKSFGYSELVREVKYEFKKQFDKSIGDNKAKEVITYCKNEDWLIQEESKKPYTLGKYNKVSV
ncbi:MAG: AAA family ATPase [Aquaticitalea sp.]